jgi:lysozyme
LEAKLRKLIERHEGRVPHAYEDSLGYLTIGVGHLIDRRKGGKLPDSVIDILLEHDIREHREEMLAALPWAHGLDDVRQAVLVDMAFNLGVTGLLGFKNTLESVRLGLYHQAAGQMLQSKWAKQVGSRATRLAMMMETGQWPVL